jgi:hypothetical protein
MKAAVNGSNKSYRPPDGFREKRSFWGQRPQNGLEDRFCSKIELYYSEYLPEPTECSLTSQFSGWYPWDGSGYRSGTLPVDVHCPMLLIGQAVRASDTEFPRPTRIELPLRK